MTCQSRSRSLSVLPVITAMGGVSPAGRSSCHHGFHRLVLEALDATGRQRTLDSLMALTGETDPQRALSGSLVRRLPDNTLPMTVTGSHEAPLTLEMRAMDLPEPVPAGWQVVPEGRSRVKVTVPAGQSLLVSTRQSARVQAAGQLPDGFDPASLYPSRNHPRGLQMALYAASDALGMLGLDWQTLRSSVSPEQIAVCARSLMSQLDDAGIGGMMKFPSQGRRITSKQCPLGLAHMPADFVNAYVLGNVGRTGGLMGACATFLYNLAQGVHDIRAGRARVALVGTAEAPLVPEVMEGYRAMGALAEDADLLTLDPDRSEPDWRRACRPFATNCGFTMAESAQFLVLMDDALALELGADVLAAVPDVFVHADGIKKSISAPGVGNYLTVGRAMALAKQLLPATDFQQHCFISAHGTGTPQNRVTESRILDQAAGAFDLDNLPVTAVKCFLGHSLASAAGDQVMAALGTFATGWLPGITTIGQVADDVHRDRLSFSREHRQMTASAGLINAKGFGGNNATALLLSPSQTGAMLARKHGHKALASWQHRRAATLDRQATYDDLCLDGQHQVTYRFGEAVLDDAQVSLTAEGIRLAGEKSAIRFDRDPDWSVFEE